MAPVTTPTVCPADTPAMSHRDAGRAWHAATPLALLLGAGGLLAISTSNHAVPIAAWLAPILMVRFLRTSPVRRGLLAGAAVNAVAFSWAWQAQWPVPPLLLAGLATVFFLPYLADRLLAERLGPLLGTFVLPFALVVVEHALVRLPLLEGTPIGSWAAVVHSQYGQLPLLQLVALTGSAGITFLITWTATVTNLVWERGLRASIVRRIAATLGVVLVLTLTLGGGAGRRPDADRGCRLGGAGSHRRPRAGWCRGCGRSGRSSVRWCVRAAAGLRAGGPVVDHSGAQRVSELVGCDVHRRAGLVA
jgi:apolipoprotein N-acyltransferase